MPKADGGSFLHATQSQFNFSAPNTGDGMRRSEDLKFGGSDSALLLTFIEAPTSVCLKVACASLVREVDAEGRRRGFPACDAVAI